MKKRMYLFIALFMGASGLYAQDCATGYCPSTITVHHKAGDLAPETVNISYEVVAIGSYCWLGRHLGASSAGYNTGYALSYNGWWFQYGLKQGYNTAASVPTSITLQSSAWASTNDPCTLSLGSAWHVPTYSDAATLTSTNFSWGSTVDGKIPVVITQQVYNGAGLGTSAYYFVNTSGTFAYFSTAAAMVSWNASYQNNGGEICGYFNAVYGSGSNYSSNIATKQIIGMPVRCVKLKSN